MSAQDPLPGTLPPVLGDGDGDLAFWIGAAFKHYYNLAVDRGFWHGIDNMFKVCIVKDCPCVGGTHSNIKGILNA